MLKFIKEYFNLSNNEQRGLIATLLIVIILVLVPKFYMYIKPAAEVPKDNTALLAKYFTEKETEKPKGKKSFTKKNSTPIHYHTFNPNTVSKNELISLGFSEKTAAIFINFRNKGGKFYKKEDVKKVYGVNENLYNNIAPYIIIPEKEWNKTSKKYDIESNKDFEEKKEYKKDIVKPVLVNINSADSATLRTIYGIGATFAERILKYRNLLGGFTHKEQLLNVYGMTQETYDNIKNQVFVSGAVTQLNINTSSWKDLKSHPYISSDKANIFTKYVKTHGKVNSLTEILNLSIFTEEEIQLLTPYLTTE